MPPIPLPGDAFIDTIRQALERHRAAVLTAAPGAGKTTRVPPALVDKGRVLLLQPRRARPDFRILVMSATLETAPVSRFLGDCPVIEVPGTPHPLSITYGPGQTMADALAAADAKSFKDLDLAAHLPWAARQAIDRDAPDTLTVPSGRAMRLD